MKKSVLLVAVLFAVAGLMGAFAYTSASVTSDAALTVTNTDAALLAMIASPDHNAAYYTGHQANSKRLKVNWAKGYDNQDFGIQAYSTYLWDDLFAVKNNSENAINVVVYLNPDLSPANIHFEAARVANRWVNVAAEKLEFELQPNEETWISTKLSTTSGMSMSLGSYNFDLIVEAEKI